jgi:ABC-type Fe3+ transport system permease subunit
MGPDGVSLASFAKFFSSKYYYGVIINSLMVTLSVTVCTCLLAVPLAYVLTTVKIRFASIIQILILISSTSAILSWISILTELSTSVILYTTATRTMTLAIYTEVLRGNYGTAAALSSILSAITIVSLLVFFKLSGKRELSV